MLRLEALVEMFTGLGREATEEKLAYYGNLTKGIPIQIFKKSCRLAALDAKGGWPPGPGDIVSAALEISPGVHTPGQGQAKPRWYQRLRREIAGRERPREIGARSGAAEPGEIVSIAGGK